MSSALEGGLLPVGLTLAESPPNCGRVVPVGVKIQSSVFQVFCGVLRLILFIKLYKVFHKPKVLSCCQTEISGSQVILLCIAIISEV